MLSHAYALCISPAVADVVHGYPWKDVLCSPSPASADMIAVLCSSLDTATV
jgi:hypothetical protein